jgi:hypothetical protein
MGKSELSLEEHRTILKCEIKNVMKGTKEGMLQAGYRLFPAQGTEEYDKLLNNVAKIIREADFQSVGSFYIADQILTTIARSI